MERQRILEISAATAFVLLLIVASVAVVSAYRNPRTETTIANSFNTYTYNTNPSPSYSMMRYSKPYIMDRRDYTRVYYFDDRYDRHDRRYYYDSDRTERRYLRYDDAADLRTYKGIVNNRVHSYEVFVRNRDYVGGYFKITFYFEDYYGNIDSKSVRHYIPAREEMKFTLKDVSPGRYDYRYWWYEIESQSKIPSPDY